MTTNQNANGARTDSDDDRTYPQERATAMKMLTAEPAIAFRRIKDKKTGKPRIAVTRENIVEEVRDSTDARSVDSILISSRLRSRVKRNCHLIASRLRLNGRIHAYNP